MVTEYLTTRGVFDCALIARPQSGKHISITMRTIIGPASSRKSLSIARSFRWVALAAPPRISLRAFSLTILNMFLVDYLFNPSDPSATTPSTLRSVEETFEMVVNPVNAETRSIAIHHAMNGESQLFRLQRGTRLHIVPGASLLGRRVALFCNLPVNGKWSERIT